MGGRRKLTLMIAGLAVLVLAGTVGVLAKTGKLKMFADIDQPILTLNVKYSDNNPVTGEHVLIAQSTNANGPYYDIGTEITDNQGIARISLESNQYYNFNVSIPHAEGDPCEGSLNAFRASTTSRTMTLNCQTGSSGSDPPTTTTPTETTTEASSFSVRGSVLNQQTVRGISGVAVTVLINGQSTNHVATTDDNGRYDLRNITLRAGLEASSYKLKFTKEGFNSKTVSLNGDLGIRVIGNGSYYDAITVSLTPVGFSPTPTVSSTALNPARFTLIGKVQDSNGQYLEGVSVEISCESCGVGPWQGSSSTSTLGSVTGIPYEYNYAIEDIYNISQQGSKIPNLLLTAGKEGYLTDKNNNGIDDDEFTNIIIWPNEITQIGNRYIVKKDLKLIKREVFTYRAKIVSAETPDQPYAGAGVSLYKNWGNLDLVGTSSSTSSFRGTDNPYNLEIKFNRPPDSPSDGLYRISPFIPETHNMHCALGPYNLYFGESDTVDGVYYQTLTITRCARIVVLDEDTHQPIKDASIKFIDITGKEMQFSGITNHDGYYQTTSNNKPLLDSAYQIKVSRRDYYTRYKQIQTYSGYDFEILMKKSPEEGMILTRVSDDTTGEPIFLATVKKILRRNRGDILKDTKLTDLFGLAEFTGSQQGQFTFSADKNGYYIPKNGTSIIPLNIDDPKESHQIDLTLIKNEGGEISEEDRSLLSDTFYILTFNQYLKPVDATVEILDSEGGSIDVNKNPLGGGGVFLPNLIIGDTYSIKATFNGEVIEREITIPADYWNFSEDERFMFTLSNMLFVFSEDEENAFNKIDFIVRDGTGSKPIANAEMTLDFEDKLFASFRALTKNAGEATFKDDFAVYSAEENLSYDINSVLTQILSNPDERINVTVKVPDYNEYHVADAIGNLVEDVEKCKSDPSMCVIYIDLTRSVESCQTGGKINLSFNDYNSDIDTSLAPDEYKQRLNDDYLSKLKIFKRSGARWQKLDSNQYKINTVEVTSPYQKYPLPLLSGSSTLDPLAVKVTIEVYEGGEYRVSIPEIGYRSEARQLSEQFGCETGIWMEDICSKSKRVVPFDNGNVMLTFSSDAIYEQYLSDPETQQLYRQLVDRIIYLKRNTLDVGKITLAVEDSDILNAYASISPDENVICNGVPRARQIILNRGMIDSAKNQNILWLLKTVIDHEYGHHVYFIIKESNKYQKFYQNFKRLYDFIFLSSGLSSEIFNNLNEGFRHNIPYARAGHPWDNDDEFFASYFSGMFDPAGALYKNIRYRTDNEQVRNYMAFIWNLVDETVAKQHRPFFQHAFSKKYSDTYYPFKQIISGWWIKQQYAALSFSRRVEVATQAYVTPSVNSASSNYRQAVARFNSLVDQLVSLFNLNKGSIQGSLYKTNPSTGAKIPLPRHIVRIGPRIAITNARGKFTIKRIPVGNQKIKQVRDIFGNKNIKFEDPGKVVVSKNLVTTVNIVAK